MTTYDRLTKLYRRNWQGRHADAPAPAPAPSPPPSGHRYWRINNMVVAGDDLQLTEFQLWENSATRADDVDTNVDIGEPGNVFFGSPIRLVDGNYGNYIELYPGSSTSIVWDFGSGVTKAITGFKFANRAGGGTNWPTSLRIQYSDDASAWITSGTASGIAESPNVLSDFIPFV